MQVPATNAALDLPAHLVPQVATFAAGLQRATFAQLVALAGRLDRSRQAALAVDRSAAALGVAADLSGVQTHAACLWQLVEAELERRLSARPDAVK